MTAAVAAEESPGRVQPPSHHAQGSNIPFGQPSLQIRRPLWGHQASGILLFSSCHRHTSRGANNKWHVCPGSYNLMQAGSQGDACVTIQSWELEAGG